MGKLSSGDPLETRRQLYMRNVSSKDLDKKVGRLEEPEEDAEPATRNEGNTIAFHRSALTLCLLSHVLCRQDMSPAVRRNTLSFHQPVLTSCLLLHILLCILLPWVAVVLQ